MTARVSKGLESCGTQGLVLSVEAPETATARPHRMLAAEVPADEDAEARTGAPPGLLGELQGQPLGGDDVVAPDYAFGLHREELVELDGAERDEGGGGIGRGPAELGVEGEQEAVAEMAVGRGHGWRCGPGSTRGRGGLQGAIGALDR